jgi:hypothetical protein
MIKVSNSEVDRKPISSKRPNTGATIDFLKAKKNYERYGSNPKDQNIVGSQIKPVSGKE